MKFASSMPSSSAGFEYKVSQMLGVDVSPEALIAIVAFAAVSLLFKSSLISSGLR